MWSLFLGLILFFGVPSPNLTDGVFELMFALAVHQGETGLDLVPNLAFWRAMPGLIGDGAYFTWHQLKELKARRGYGRM